MAVVAKVVSAATQLSATVAVSATLTNGERILRINDFPTGAFGVEALGLFVAGTKQAGGSVWSRPPRSTLGTLLDGVFAFDHDDEPLTPLLPINEIQIRNSNTRIRFIKTGGGPFSTYFAEGAAGRYLTLWILTDYNTAGWASWNVTADNISVAGNNFVEFDVPQEYQSILGGINNGVRFIAGWTSSVRKSLQVSRAFTGVLATASILSKTTAAPKSLQGSSVSEGTVAVSAVLSGVTISAKLVTGAYSMEGAVSVVGALTKVPRPVKQLRAAPAAVAAVAVAANLSKSAAVAKQLTGAYAMEGTVSVSASLVAEVVGQKLIEAAPAATAAVEVAASLSKVSVGAKSLQAAPAVAGTVATVASLSKSALAAKSLQAAPAAAGAVAVAASLSKVSAGFKQIQAAPSADAVVSVSASLLRFSATFKDLAASSVLSGDMAITTAWLRPWPAVVPLVRAERQHVPVPDVEAYLDLMISQYRDSDRLRAFIRANLELLQNEIVTPIFSPGARARHQYRCWHLVGLHWRSVRDAQTQPAS